MSIFEVLRYLNNFFCSVFMFLPETLGEKLPESMEEALQLGKSKKQLPKENGGFSMNENGGFSE